MPHRQSTPWIAALLAAVAGVFAPHGMAQAPWKPDKAVEVGVGSTPGGGNDRTARASPRLA